MVELLLLLLLVGRYWVPRYLLVPGTAATLDYCTNPDDKWGWFLEKLVEWKLAGETKVLGENLPQRHFVHHKIPHDRHVKWLSEMEKCGLMQSRQCNQWIWPINITQMLLILNFTKIWLAVTMKNAVFWDVAPCRYCVNRRFGGMYRRLQPPAHAGSSFADIFLSWRWRRYIPQKRRFTQYLYSATSQKTAFYMKNAHSWPYVN
jgi:hypothetical protein